VEEPSPQRCDRVGCRQRLGWKFAEEVEQDVDLSGYHQERHPRLRQGKLPILWPAPVPKTLSALFAVVMPLRPKSSEKEQTDRRRH
jgi:hypothetical protein